MTEFVREIVDLLMDLPHHNPLLGCFHFIKNCECFALRTSYRKNEQNYLTLVSFYLIMCLSFAILKMNLYPEIERELYLRNVEIDLSSVLKFNQVFFYLSMLLNFVLTIKDPGFIKPTQVPPPSPRDTFSDISESIQSPKILYALKSL